IKMLKIALLIVCAMIGGAQSATLESENDATSLTPEEWIQRRQEFFIRTTFQLPDEVKGILSHSLNRTYASRITANLPFYFDYELFKATFNRKNKTPQEEGKRHSSYINNCFTVFQHRAFYRMLLYNSDMLIDEKSDYLPDERVGQDVNYTNQTVPSDNWAVDDAIKLVLDEFKRVESPNEARWYLDLLQEFEGNVIQGKLPYVTVN
ncbi:hypothetical protein GZH46_02890, partial [Fragariocoptes setiger]